MLISPSQIKKLFLSLALAIATSLPTLAEENLISQVIITKSKDVNHAYELNIDSTQMVQYKSHIDSDGNVYFDLKNSILAKDLGTIYDDVIDIDNVTVKQLEKNRVRIYVNGRNARNTQLVFMNSVFETKNQPTKKVVINRPIKEYKPTSYEANDLEFEQDMQEWDDNSFNFYHLSSSVLNELKNGPSGKILILLTLFIILVGLIKNVSSKLRQEKEPLIGLNNSRYLPNNHQIGSLGLTPKVPRKEIDETSRRNETLKQAQAQLNIAHQKYQEYIQNKYKGLKKPQNIDTDVIRKSIALNQYQKSTQNPYRGQEVIKMNKGFSDDIAPRSNFIPPRPKINQTPIQKPEFTSPYIKKTNNFIDTNTKKTQQNMKFLDSVTKIYERSGRTDLADGLKNSITKAKQTI